MIAGSVGHEACGAEVVGVVVVNAKAAGTS